MPKQWVDITTLDNVTPFGKVRWLQNLTIANNTSNFLEFSELSGITIDNRLWHQNAGAAWGYASTHRVAPGDASFTCTFLNQYRTSNDVSVSASKSTAGTAVHDVKRSVFYDDVVTMSGQTFYEVDFTTWSGYTPLYYCYTGTSVSAGQVYVELGTDPILIDKDKISFKATGGSDTVVVTADDSWTAVVSDNWITASTLSGGSGDTTVTVSVPNYTDTTTDRTGTIVFTCSGFSVTLTVRQKRVISGGIANVYLGDLAAEAMYVGDLQVEAMYLGDDLIFPQPTPIVVTGFTKCAYSNFNPQAGEYYTFASLYSDNKWYVPSSSFSNGTSVCSEVTYSNDTITNLPSDLLLFEIETATGGYYLKLAGTNNYLQVSGTNLSLGSTPALFTFSEDIIDANGSIIYVSSDAAVCKPDSGNRMLIINAYVSGDPDPLYAREFMLDYIDSSSFGFVCKLFKAI